MFPCQMKKIVLQNFSSKIFILGIFHTCYLPLCIMHTFCQQILEELHCHRSSSKLCEHPKLLQAPTTMSMQCL